MAMGEFAVAGVLGQKVPAFQFNGFADSVGHEGRIAWEGAGGNPNQSLPAVRFSVCGTGFVTDSAGRGRLFLAGGCDFWQPSENQTLALWPIFHGPS